MTQTHPTAENTTPTTIADIFIWDKRFETGIPEIDSQHRTLVQLINSLGHILATETDSECFENALLEVFDELSAYIDYHFRFEENLMSDDLCDTRHKEAHKRAHAEFIQYISAARVEARQRPAEVSGRTLTFLSKWLITHIIGTDILMAQKILAVRSGAPGNIAEHQVGSHTASATGTLLQAMDYLYDCLANRAHDLLVAKRALDHEIATRKKNEEALRKLSQAVEHSPVSIIITNADGEFEYVNPKFTQLTGYSLQDLMGKTPNELKSDEIPEAVYDSLWATIRSGQEWHGELRNRKKNGECYWDYVAISPVFDPEGEISHYVSTMEDITERKLTEERLIQQQEFSENIINSLPGIFYMLDDQGKFVRVNPKFLSVTGYTWKEVEQMTALDFFTGKDRTAIRKRIQEIFSRGGSSAEARFVIKSGKKIPYYFTGHRTRVGAQDYLVGLGTDITERHKLEQELIRQARIDILTGLNNRRHFLYLAEQEMKRAKRYNQRPAMLMVDLDEFKEINDQYGHQTGDEVLSAIGEVFRRTLRDSDISGRLGGEEFAIILPEDHGENTIEVADRLRREIAATPIPTEHGGTVNFTASIGIATSAAENTDLDQLFGQADKALYEAKRGGRNRISSYSETKTDTSR